MTIKAIDTRYGGYLFRSRLEARWAVFFDQLGLRWEYEPEGFDIDGTRYLPDFRVTTPQGEPIWYEVKRRDIEGDPKFAAFEKAISSPETNTDTVCFRAELLSGDPTEMLSAADICPRCGVIQRRGRMSVMLNCVTGAGDEDSHVYCFSCDGETPCGGDEPSEIGFLGATVRPHKGDVAFSLREWNRIMAKRILPAAHYAREARFEHRAKP